VSVAASEAAATQAEDPRSVQRTLTDTYAGKVADAVDAIESAAGGRDALLAALLTSLPSEDLAYVVRAIADPRSDARKLSSICKAYGITIGEVIEAYKRGVLAKPTVEAIRIVAQATPGVVTDIMRRGQPFVDTCPTCSGTTTVTVITPGAKRSDPSTVTQEPCKACKATGEVVALPSVDQQKLALSLTPLAPKSSPLVAVQQVDARALTFSDPTPAGFGKLLTLTDEVLHRRRRPAPQATVDGEVV
jgi:hypothetical protein